MPITADTDLRLRRERLVRASMDAKSRHDVEATLAVFADPACDVVPLGVAITGEVALAELFHQLFDAFPDLRLERLATYDGDNIVVVDTRMTGTQCGAWAGVPATGRPIDIRCACIYHFEEDRLVKETVFFDQATLLAQIGVGS
ncbi:MAG TPA: ester cyclase [Acidimicrobiales bacterium]|jgi:steroid delta-isomerase-like uncharacterized protein